MHTIPCSDGSPKSTYSFPFCGSFYLSWGGLLVHALKRQRFKSFWSGGLLERLIAARSHQPANCVLVYADCSMPGECVSSLRGLCTGRGLTPSEGSARAVRCGGAIMSQRESFPLQNNQSRTGIASDHTHTHVQLRQADPSERRECWANTWRTFMAVITTYSVHSFTRNDP